MLWWMLCKSYIFLPWLEPSAMLPCLLWLEAWACARYLFVDGACMTAGDPTP